MRLHLSFPAFSRALAVFCLLASVVLSSTKAQQATQKPATKSEAKEATPAEPQNPAQFELLETKYRFEANGDSRKEVHALVHINSELGARQFARLNFDYNRSFQSIDIPLVHITHPTGGTADILPSAITDNPNPAVINAPAYQDVRVKSVRILGLAPGDNLEYRVITTTTHHPLAPDFWLDHSFDRTGVVSQEIFELDLPASPFEGGGTTDTYPPTPDDPAGVVPPESERLSPKPRPHSGIIYVSSNTPETAKEKTQEGETTRLHYLWKATPSDTSMRKTAPDSIETIDSDVVVTTFWSWESLAGKFSALCYSWPPSDPPSIQEARKTLLTSLAGKSQPEEVIYDFVSRKIRTINITLGAAGFRGRSPSETLSSGYGTAAEKVGLFIALLGSGKSSCGLVPNPAAWRMLQLYRPSLFGQPLVYIGSRSRKLYLDPSLEVAPFGLLRADLRGKDLLIPRNPADLMGMIIQGPRDFYSWQVIPRDLPFPANQKVNVEATLAADGKLAAKVHYTLRGDNELLLRLAFHQSPKEKWKDLAQLLSLSDGFRGQVTSATASDPYATREPFTVDYEIVQPKFVDWSKKPIRMPALLPQLGLPDPPAKPAQGAATAPIELGTPLEVETKMILRLPAGTDVAAPTGTSVQRDYATFASQYSIKGLTVTASRHINFLLRQVPADRAADYNAFLRAVLGDQAQNFTLDRESPPAPATAPPSTPKP